MLLNPSNPDPSGLLAALQMLPGPQRQALVQTLAGYRDECAGDMPRMAAVWNALLGLASAVHDDQAATFNRLELDTLGTEYNRLELGAPNPAPPDENPGSVE